MIIIFFALNIVIFLVIALATNMLGNHIKKISKSIDIHLDPKAYKPESQVQFISSLVDMYAGYQDKTSVEEMDELISDRFYEEKIGIFRLVKVDAVACKGKQLLWVSMLIMVFFEGLTTGLGNSWINSMLILSSIGLGFILILFQLCKNIDRAKEKLFIKIKNYLYSTYPELRAKQKDKQQISLLEGKVNSLKDEIKILKEINEQLSKENDGAEELVEDDIIQLIEYFVSPD